MFQQPSQGDKFVVADHLGSLCLLFVHQVVQGVTTSFGDKEAVSCDVHVLDGNDAGEIFQDCLIFQGGLIGSLRRAAGGNPVLARIGQGIAKPGQTAPFILTEFTADDAAKAEAYLTERAKKFTAAGSNGNSQPAPAAADPAPPGGLTKEAFDALPDEVKALLAQR